MAAEHRALPVSRRRFVHSAGVAGLGLLAGCGRLQGQASKSTQLPVVGILMQGSASMPDDALGAGFRQGLIDHNLVEGQSIRTEYRYAHLNFDLLPGLAAELATLPVDVLVAVGGQASQAAKSATTSVPVIMAGAVNPVDAGLVPTLARPGGNVTGTTVTVGRGLNGKRLQLLQAVVPGLSRVAVLRNPEEAGLDESAADMLDGAKALGVAVRVLQVRQPAELESTFDAIKSEALEAVLFIGGPLFQRNLSRITDLALQHSLPTMQARGDWAQGGALMSYGPSFFEVSRQSAALLAKVLAGTKPADLPVEQPREFDFVINLKTAQALGLTIPQHVLLQATEVIQ